MKVSGPLESVSVPFGGVVSAKPIKARNTPEAQRRNAKKMRGLKSPDSEDDFFFMVTFPLRRSDKKLARRENLGSHEHHRDALRDGAD